MTQLAPVALFVYGRPDHTRQVLRALAANTCAPDTDLHIFSDAAKRPAAQPQVDAVRRVIREEALGFRSVTIVERAHNLGLSRSILGGVSALLAQHGRIIVLEDDLITAPQFLRYMNEALERYQNDARIFSISGYTYPDEVMAYPPHYQGDVYLSVRNSSWGWATWHDRWAGIDWDVRDYPAFRRSYRQRRAFNKGGDDMADMLDMQMAGIINSWAIRFSYAQFKAGAFSVAPRRSFVANIGFDGSGEHCGDTPALTGDLSRALTSWRLPADLQPDAAMLKAFAQVNAISLATRIKHAVKSAGKATLTALGVDVNRVKRWMGKAP